jgi:multimeric flavodoxin WrbA
MKVVVLGGSPKKRNSNTDLILEPFIAGMEEAGAEVEVVRVWDLELNHCRGDFYCWYNDPGQCFQKDDMQELFPKLRDADVWVLASPLYVDGMTGPLKTVLDRTIPLIQPFLELREGATRRKIRDKSWNCKVVLVSNCGNWEIDNFDPLVHHTEAACKNMSMTYAGALLRPHGEIMWVLKKQESSELEEVFSAAREAGRQLIEDGEMDPETLERVSSPLVPKDTYVTNANRYFQKMLEKKNDTTNKQE